MTQRDDEQLSEAPDGRPEVEQPYWRREFPVDLPQDRYVARRGFTKFMVLISCAFAVGQLWIGVQTWFRRRRGTPPRQSIANVADIPVGGVVSFHYPEEDEP